jgi:hypothetical protein
MDPWKVMPTIPEVRMDGSRFDQLTRTLATGSSRRGFFRSVLGGAAALAGLGAAMPGTAQHGKVGICHKTWAWSSDYRYITVDARDQRRIAAHLDHGDTVNPDLSSDPSHCGACGNACDAPANATAFCSGGGCGWTCDTGYIQDGDACVVNDPCPLHTSATPYCYHLQFQGTIGYCWVPWDPGFTFCQQQDGCHPGGGNLSGGGCFKWTNNSNDPFTSWPA